MMKTLIAGVTALSLAVVPAQANEFNEEDFGKLLFGIVAAIALNAAVNKGRDRGAEPEAQAPVLSHPSQTAPRVNPNTWAEPPVVRHVGPRINPGPRHEPPVVRHQPGGLRPYDMVLPGQCFRRIETRFGTTNLFGRRCLERNYRYTAQLPQNCAVRVFNTNNRPRQGFDPACLRQMGFSSDRGRW